MTNDFQFEGFPTITLFDEYFEIKGIESENYTSFKYAEISKIVYDKIGSKGTWFLQAWLQSLLSHLQPYRLKITKKDNLKWTFNTKAEPNTEFEAILQEISRRCRKWSK